MQREVHHNEVNVIGRFVAMVISIGLLVTAVLGEEWVEGEAILLLTREGNAKGIEAASFDSLNRAFGVVEMVSLLRGQVSPIEREYGLDRVYLARFSPRREVTDFVQAYGSLSQVELVEANYVYRTYRQPDDSLFSSQWNLRKTLCPEGWDIQTGTDSVVIAVVDLGTDWQHEDLRANLWTNQIEDINFTGEFEPWHDSLGGDLNGIDDDLNGYVDDIIGWDFATQDNNPTPVPGETHGTWCNGIANAVADNQTGIAGTAFNCRSMALRHTMVTSTLIQGINYARANGAHVISCSWGSYHASAVLDTAIQAAHAAGVVICAAAGNEDTDDPHYPSCYDNVISVAATNYTDHLDRSWSHSNYGDCVDVCAPGYGVYGTMPGDLYEEGGGTSGSSPQVAALAALLRARYPDSSNTFIENRIFNSCDSMPDTLFAQGKLGHGRINVFKALALGDYCWLRFADFEVDDSTQGNGNGRPESAETVSVVVTLANSAPWADASSIQARLSTDADFITILDSTVSFPDISSGSSQSNSADPFTFSADSAAPSWITFWLEWQVTPESYSERDSFQVLFGFPEILLVDDDDGGTYETYYENTFDSLGVMFESWSTKESGNLGDRVFEHSVLVWYTGDDSSTTLTSEEQADISAFLDDGGKLFITGQSIGQDIGGQPFYTDYLHAEYLSPRMTTSYLSGVAGDEVGDGLTVVTTLNQSSRDAIRPLAGADSVLMYSADSCAAIKYEGAYKVVYFGFGFEGIHDHPATSGKTLVMSRVLNWLNPSVGVTEEDTDGLLGSLRPFLYNFPNPFSSVTKIAYYSPDLLELRIYDIAGREVRRISLEKKGRGFAIWDGRDDYGKRLPPGAYFCRFGSTQEGETRKILILK